MERLAKLVMVLVFLTPAITLPDDETEEDSSAHFAYSLAELEELIDTSPQIQLLQAKQEETRRKESVWHDVSISASFNPIRTADQFTDRIRAGLSVAMPLDILLFGDTSRVSPAMKGLELRKIRGDLKRELRRLWYERERRLVEI